MLRKFVWSCLGLSGLLLGTWGAGEFWPRGTLLFPAVLAQPESPALPAEQPEVTERGLPGQAAAPRPGLAFPGGQSTIPKVRLLPKLPGSPPPPLPKELGPGQKPGAAPKHGPDLGQMLNAYRALPGGSKRMMT
jgi:hypothetical protein